VIAAASSLAPRSYDDRGPRNRFEPTRRVNGSALATMQRQLVGVGYKWKLFCEDKGMENQCFVKAASASGRCAPGGIGKCLRAARCVPLHTGRDTVGNRIVPLLLNLFDALLQFTCAALRLFLPPMP
jgi:hypothetical protein